MVLGPLDLRAACTYPGQIGQRVQEEEEVQPSSEAPIKPVSSRMAGVGEEWPRSHSRGSCRTSSCVINWQIVWLCSRSRIRTTHLVAYSPVSPEDWWAVSVSGRARAYQKCNGIYEPVRVGVLLVLPVKALLTQSPGFPFSSHASQITRVCWSRTRWLLKRQFNVLLSRRMLGA